jgi:hypothetical protein
VSCAEGCALTQHVEGLQVDAGLRQIGYGSTAAPYWVHAFMAWALSCLPKVAVNAYLMYVHKGLRSRWYKKQQRQKKE